VTEVEFEDELMTLIGRAQAAGIDRAAIESVIELRLMAMGEEDDDGDF
jgi:hypothetical protein